MNRCIRDKREKLRKQSIALRELATDKPGQVGIDMREKQGVIYNKWKFYDGIIKASERVNSRNN